MARHAGTPLKRIALSFAGDRVPGDAMITQTGIEGGPIYALGARLRDAIARDGAAIATLDLRPDLTQEALATRLSAARRGQSLSSFLRKAAGLPPLTVALLRECGADLGALPSAIKALPLRLTAPAGLDRAISTAGGLHFGAALPDGVFAAGEMLDWEAPTGGYLLQAAFSTGYAAGEAALAWIRSRPAG